MHHEIPTAAAAALLASVFFDQPLVQCTAAALVVFQITDALLGTTFGEIWKTRRPWLGNLPFFFLILVVVLYWFVYAVS